MTATVDVCVCTRNRPLELGRCLVSVFASHVPARRVIVSDDSSDGLTRMMVAREFPDALWLEGPRRGLGPNRNRALTAVQGDYVLFLDDDAVLDGDFIGNALAAAAAAPQAIFTGPELNNGREVKPQDQNFLGFQRRAYRPGEALNTAVINSAMIPAALAKALGFDEQLVFGCEEVDFWLRARGAGAAIIWRDDLVNRHFPSPANRVGYEANVPASRLYVTFKRYWLLERNKVKAWWFLAVASLHLLAAGGKRQGLAGLRTSLASLRRSYRFIHHFLATSGHAHRRDDPELPPAA